MRRIVELIAPDAWALIPEPNQREIRSIDCSRAIDFHWKDESLPRLSDKAVRSRRAINVRSFVKIEVQRLVEADKAHRTEKAAFEAKFLERATAFFYRTEPLTNVPIYTKVAERRYIALKFASQDCWTSEALSMTRSAKRQKDTVGTLLRRYRAKWGPIPEEIVNEINALEWGDLLDPSSLSEAA